MKKFHSIGSVLISITFVIFTLSNILDVNSPQENKVTFGILLGAWAIIMVIASIKYTNLLNKKIRIQDDMLNAQNGMIDALTKLKDKEHENYLEMSLMNFMNILRRDDVVRIMNVFYNKNLDYKENKVMEILEIMNSTAMTNDTKIGRVSAIIDSIA